VAGEPPRLDRDGRWRADGERIVKQEGPLWPRFETVDTQVRHPDKHEKVVGADLRVGPRETATVADHPTPPVTSAASTTPPAQPAPPGGDRLSIDDFMKVELRVAKVLSAERVPKSNKLLKLQVDVGTEQRTLVAGIADAYEPDALVGKSVVVVFNLKPAKLMGIESNGMVLAASPDGGKPIVVTFEQPPAPGTRVR
jgi:methionyl-tRNA synthetase